MSFGSNYVIDDMTFPNNSLLTIDTTRGLTTLIYFTLNQDGVTQEQDEDFVLRIVDINGRLPSGVELRSQLNGTIVDSDGMGKSVVVMIIYALVLN